MVGCSNSTTISPLESVCQQGTADSMHMIVNSISLHNRLVHQIFDFLNIIYSTWRLYRWSHPSAAGGGARDREAIRERRGARSSRGVKR